MKKLWPAIIFFLVLPMALFSQTLRRPMAAVYTGFGAYSLHHADVFSFTANQASLAQLKNAAAGVYGERRFMLAGLNYYLFVAGLPVKPGAMGLKASYFGFNDYNETQVGLAYARHLGNRVDIGIQFNYNGISIAGYGNASAVTAELGTILHLSDKLKAGIQLTNPVGGKFGKNRDEKLPAVFTAGLGYEASEKFFISAEIQKEEDQPVNVNAGFQYHFIPFLRVRAGMASATSTAWFGAGFSLKSFRLDIMAGFHPHLGFSPGLSLLFEIGKNKNE